MPLICVCNEANHAVSHPLTWLLWAFDCNRHRNTTSMISAESWSAGLPDDAECYAVAEMVNGHLKQFPLSLPR